MINFVMVTPFLRTNQVPFTCNNELAHALATIHVAIRRT
jgi:hypothetical protein